MVDTTNIPANWKSVETIAGAKALIDYGMLLSWQEAKRLAKAFSPEDGEEFVKHLALRLAEKNETRLIDEMLVETMLGWLSNASSEKPMQVFLEAFLTQPNPGESACKLAEIALTAELVDPEHDDEMFSTAVTLICEMGLAIKDLDRKFPGQIERVHSVMDHIATYLLSVSNTNSSKTRLSLLNYFGASESGQEQKIGFNKVMSRFGHTVLDQLFALLFTKKTEAVALQYLMENLPFVLEGDRHAQTIVHETWKFYMLKNPERFGLFLKTFCETYTGIRYHETLLSRRPLIQHLGALLRVASEVNHRELIQIIISCFVLFEPSKERSEVIDALLQLEDIRPAVKSLLQDLRDSVDTSKIIESASRFVDTKRGRKPSFARVEGWVTMNQVNFLGDQATLLKAS